VTGAPEGEDMPRFLTFFVSLAALSLGSCSRQAAAPDEPPLEIKFLSATGTLFGDDAGVTSCGVPNGRTSCYDPETGVFHVQVNVYGEVEVGFEITKVSERIPKSVTFRLTRVAPNFGCVGRPMALSVKGRNYPLVPDVPRKVDPALFRVESDGDAVVVAFTEKGQKLLEPGARIGYSVDNNW
jgi:hypothetical protein